MAMQVDKKPLSIPGLRTIIENKEQKIKALPETSRPMTTLCFFEEKRTTAEITRIIKLIIPIIDRPITKPRPSVPLWANTLLLISRNAKNQRVFE